MKPVAVACFIMGLFYPSLTWGVSLKEVPQYCKLALRALVSSDIANRKEIPTLTTLEILFDQKPVVDYDPINLARGSHFIIDDKNYSLFTGLSLTSKAYLLTKYTEYFNIDQLRWITEESWFQWGDGILDSEKKADMQAAVKDQIRIFEELAQGADFVDRSIANKYSKQFRDVEFSDYYSELTLVRMVISSTKIVHGYIYNFMKRGRSESVSAIYDIEDEIESIVKKATEKDEQLKTEEEKAAYRREIIPLVEGANAYFEFLILHYLSELNSVQFIRLIDNYQIDKRQLIRIALSENDRSKPTNSLDPESWNFYGELLGAGHKIKLSSNQIESLWHSFKPDVLTMAMLIESRGIKVGALKKDDRNAVNLKNISETILSKIWDYGNAGYNLDAILPRPNTE